MPTIILLVASNVFMTAAWYGHLKYPHSPLWLAILASWGLAFFEYCLQVPANRWGYGEFTASQLKVIQEVITLLVFAALGFTRIGKAMRATSFDREAAAMMGIDIDRVIVFAFVLGSALAGAAGVLTALRVPTSASEGFLFGLKGFTAAVIGGIGNLPGAVVGALLGAGLALHVPSERLRPVVLVLGFALCQGYCCFRDSEAQGVSLPSHCAQLLISRCAVEMCKRKNLDDKS